MVAQHPVVHAESGPPLGSDVTRQRDVGRIGGWLGVPDSQAARALGCALGPRAQLLDGDGALDAAASRAGLALVCDWDSCWAGGAPVENVERWRAIVDEGRLETVYGAFVLAWLRADGALCLARDAVGERTLYYARVGRGMIFASTLRALLATGLVPRALHLPAVARYLTYAYVPGRETLVEGIHELLPGEVVTFQRGGLDHRQYWSLPADDPAADGSAAGRPDPVAGPEWEAALRGRLRARLEQAVARCLPAGEPVGATLSGGVDSSLVVALARRLHDAPVLTYSVSFGPQYPNELAYSSLVAAHCGTAHCIVELPPEPVVQHLDDAIGLLDQPIGDPLTVPNALMFRETARSVGVVLNGEGGDPCFGGPKNLPMVLAELLGDGANTGPAEDYARERSYLRAHQKCFDDLPTLLAPAARGAVGEASLERHLAPYLADSRYRTFVNRLMAINVTFKGAHHILPKVDALSAPFGVLARSPLFDRAVVEEAFAIPPQLKLRGAVEKYLLKQAVADLLPRAILERPKSGMLVPVEGWFRGPLLPLARARLLDGLAPYGLFQRPYLERLLAGRLGGLRPRHGAKIWLLVTLEAWLRTVFQPTA